MGTVSIAGLDKSDVLAALYNAARPYDLMGFFQAAELPQMTNQAADECLAARPRQYFTVLHGRMLHLDLTDDDSFDASGYDDDNGGSGTAERVINELYATGNIGLLEDDELVSFLWRMNTHEQLMYETGLRGASSASPPP